MRSILLVGKTNAGKSSIFNALVGKTVSVVDQTENLTNDIVKFDSDGFSIYDSPGFENISEFENFLSRVKQYDTVCIVCDPNDYSPGLCASILSYFKDKKCFLIINKADLIKDETKKFGLSGIEVFYVSTFTRMGINKLRIALGIKLSRTLRRETGTATKKEISAEKNMSSEIYDDASISEKAPLTWSIFGRANVGKSSIANILVGFERFTVMDKVGTTREINPETSDTLGIKLLDTPGYRKNNSIDAVSKASQYRLENYIKKMDEGFAIFVIDATEGFLRTDRIIIKKLLEKFLLFFVVNKVDLVDEARIKDIEIEIKRMFPNVDYVFFSAVTQSGKKRLLSLIKKLTLMPNSKISTPKLNKWLETQNNKQIKYITQKDYRTFIVFSKRELSQTSVRTMSNSLCKAFELYGVVPRLEWRYS